MKKVLLTGATGFIGRHCLPSLLASGYEVHAISSKPNPGSRVSPYSPLPTPHSLDWRQTDLLDAEQVAELVAGVRPTHLLHFSWFVVPGKFWTSPENLRWVQASLNLLNAFASNGGERVVVAGSCTEYDWGYGYCSEERTPLAPSTLYGSCKHALRIMLDAFAGQTGISAAWGRIFFLYGPHEHPSRLVASVIGSLLKDEPARCSPGEQMRDFLHVRDVADAFVALLEADVTGPVNIGSGQPVAVKEIVRKIADQVGRPGLVRLGALPAAPNESPLVVADVRRLSEEVGWTPRYDLDDGLEQTIYWWRDRIFERSR